MHSCNHGDRPRIACYFAAEARSARSGTDGVGLVRLHPTGDHANRDHLMPGVPVRVALVAIEVAAPATRPGPALTAWRAAEHRECEPNGEQNPPSFPRYPRACRSDR